MNTPTSHLLIRDARALLLLSLVTGCGAKIDPLAGDPEVTWHRDVEPLVQANCVACHTDGGIAPFSLLSYAEAKPWSREMANATADRVMPPWMPAADCQSFHGARTLSDDEIAIFTAWHVAGAPAGDAAGAPAAEPPAAAALTWVDATLDSGGDYQPTGLVTDDYRCFILGAGFDTDQDLIGYHVIPGARSMVHHVILFSADAVEAVARDADQPGLGWTCYGGPGTTSPAVLGTWVPGSFATELPAGSGIRLRAGNVIIMQIHYNTEQALESDRTRVELQYAREPVARQAYILSLGERAFAIPPGATNYSVSAQATLPIGGTLWGVLPHMHQLGKRAQVTLERNGEQTCLIDIPNWDFHWQQMYFYDATQGMALVAGDKITLTCTWSNPTGETVTHGEGTGDEMCLSGFYATR